MFREYKGWWIFKWWQDSYADEVSVEGEGFEKNRKKVIQYSVKRGNYRETIIMDQSFLVSLDVNFLPSVTNGIDVVGGGVGFSPNYPREFADYTKPYSFSSFISKHVVRKGSKTARKTLHWSWYTF